MRVKSFEWLGRECVAVSCEGAAGVAGDAGVDGILDRVAAAIGRLGFSLDNTVRTRLWARDRESRNLGSRARSRRMSGGARSASSSYIHPAHLDSDARVALDLLAMRSGAAKKRVEYDPPLVPLRYLDLEGRIFLSGVTATTGDLPQQTREICGLIGASLEHAGTSWEQVVKVSFFLHHEADMAALRRAFHAAAQVPAEYTACSFVEGYSAAGKLIEVEVTADAPGRHPGGQ